MMQLIEFFKVSSYDICFATPCSKKEHSYPLEKINIYTESIEVNNSSFNNFIQKLNPDIVIFDRFMMEEQFGWRVQNLRWRAKRASGRDRLCCGLKRSVGGV